MANVHTTLSGLFTNIANAIRSKNGSTGTIIADNFPVEIENLRTGFDYSNHSVTAIADYEFKNCEDLKSVDCYNLTSIGVGAFEGCSNLKTVILYDNVESIGENAFKGCSGLTIYCYFESIPETWNENWNPDGCEVVFVALIETWDASATEEDNVTAKLYNDIHNEEKYILFISGSGNMKNYQYNTVPWESYGEYIELVNIDAGVTSIGNFAFYDCYDLTSIIIPDSVTSIGDSAFQNCTSLTSITIPDSVNSIGSRAFYNTPWLTTKQQENPLVIVNNILIDGVTCSGNITIPDGVTSIGERAFSDCTKLTSITIPDSVIGIGSRTFSGCSNLTSIEYMGTISQWNAISFISDWDTNTSNYIIHCTDGDIAKDGTITYHTTE